MNDNDKTLDAAQEGTNHRRFHPRHLSGFPNMAWRSRIDHLRWEHGYRPDGLGEDAAERVHNQLHGAL